VVNKQKDLEAGISAVCSEGFLLVQIENDSWKMKSNLNIIAEQQFGNIKYVLYRKTQPQNGHTSKIIHLNGSMSTWLRQIKKVEVCHRLYAVVHLQALGVEIIFNYMQNITNELGLEHVRYVFILDENVPNFSLNENFCKKDLVLNVFSNGEWGNICLLPLVMDHKSENELLEFHSSLENIKTSFLGLNQQFMLNKENGLSSKVNHVELAPVDFSGHLKSGSRIMGIANLDRKTNKLAFDQYYMWEVPDSWSLQQAATVPVPYAIAYNALIMKAELKRGESVLVHAGWNIIGQAAITLALDYDCTVYTTVMNNEQMTFITQRFPQILDHHIYNYEGTAFEEGILIETGGKGVKVILNCLTGSGLQASARCLGSYGRFVQLLQSDINQTETIGMYMFLRNTELSGVSFKSLSNLSPELKKILHSGIKNLIHNNVIKPGCSSVFSKRQIQQAVSTSADFTRSTKVLLSTTENDEKSSLSQVFISDSHGFYLALGSELEQCVDVAKWLALRGVKHVVILSKSDDVPKHLKQKIKLLKSYHNTKVTVVKVIVANLKSDILKLMEEVSTLCKGPLEGIFILPLESADQENGLTSSIVARLDVASKEFSSLKHFVCLLLKNSWSICEKRHKEGFPALSVYWTKQSHENFNLLYSMRLLDSLLILSKYDPVIVIDEENHSCYKPVSTLLPISLNAVARFGEDLNSNSSWLVEMVSLSPGSKIIQGVPPVFLIPGLQGPPTEILEPLARKLMYPIFCVRIVEPKNTVKETAAVLVKHIKAKQNINIYNLVGISWGGAITLEIARLLEAEGQKTRILLINGAPDTLQVSAQRLNEDGNFNLNLISTVLQTEETNEFTDWSVLLEKVLKNLSFSLKSQVSHALTFVRSCMTMLLEYKPAGQLIQGEVSLVRTILENEDMDSDVGLQK
ncbi:hypothetical protein L9F63_021359, partial [Diploptera punctata]